MNEVFDSIAAVLVSNVDKKVCSEKAARQILTVLMDELDLQGWDGHWKALLRWGNVAWIKDTFAAYGILVGIKLPLTDFHFVNYPGRSSVDVVINGGQVIYSMDYQKLRELTEFGQEVLEMFEPKPLKVLG